MPSRCHARARIFAIIRIPPRGTTIIACTHDAESRLVGAAYGQTVRGSRAHNGLNWRIMKQADTDATTGPDERDCPEYKRWRSREANERGQAC